MKLPTAVALAEAEVLGRKGDRLAAAEAEAAEGNWEPLREATAETAETAELAGRALAAAELGRDWELEAEDAFG